MNRVSAWPTMIGTQLFFTISKTSRLGSTHPSLTAFHLHLLFRNLCSSGTETSNGKWRIESPLSRLGRKKNSALSRKGANGCVKGRILGVQGSSLTVSTKRNKRFRDGRRRIYEILSNLEKNIGCFSMMLSDKLNIKFEIWWKNWGVDKG